MTSATDQASPLPYWLTLLMSWWTASASGEGWHWRVDQIREGWSKLSPEAGRRLDYVCRAIAVREARTHVTDVKVLAAIDGVLALLDRAVTGETVAGNDWAVAGSAAWACAREAAMAPLHMVGARYSASSAADDATEIGAMCAVVSAHAKRAAGRAVTPTEVGPTAWIAAEQAAANRIVSAQVDACEAALASVAQA